MRSTGIGRRIRGAVLGLAVAAAALVPVGAAAQTGDGSDTPQQLPGEGLLPDLDEVLDPGQAYPNLGSQLSELAATHKYSAADVCGASGSGVSSAGTSGPGATSPVLPGNTNSTSNEPLLVTVQLDGSQSEQNEVVDFLTGCGAAPANELPGYLEVFVPPELLAPLAAQAGVARVREA
ncbi:MAG: hypothetical protein OXF75_07200, partial [Acidimicrobiaceae bacterium]|nr:hypothetical protein [Acidimicrobiaceae bacterium]